MKIRKTFGGGAKNAEARARDADRDVATLASCLMHDFGNLLTLMSGHAELLARNATLDRRTREDVMAMRNGARRAIHLVSRWMDFVKPASPRAESINLGRVIAEVEALAVPNLGPHIQLECQVKGPLSVLSHHEHLERTLLNLVLNARDAMVNGGLISIVAETCLLPTTHQEAVRITVEDSGAGIDAQTLDRVAEPFFTTKRHGTGLGVPQVLDFVREWSGMLEVESEVGVGSSFSLILPRGQEVIDVASYSEPPPQLMEGTVLLVQPDVALAEALVPVLESAGYTVLSAAGAGDALLAMERSTEPVDAVVVDSNLAWMSSRELNALLKERYGDVPIIVLTNSALLKDPSADQIVVKPFDGKRLPQEIARLLENFSPGVSTTRIRALPHQRPIELRKRG